jgi:hypothetical protein
MEDKLARKKFISSKRNTIDVSERETMAGR